MPPGGFPGMELPVAPPLVQPQALPGIIVKILL